MKFLADECCDSSLVAQLREEGHNVSYVAEEKRVLQTTLFYPMRTKKDASCSLRIRTLVSLFFGSRSPVMELF